MAAKARPKGPTDADLDDFRLERCGKAACKSGEKVLTKAAATGVAAAAGAALKGGPSTTASARVACPPNKEELGRASWTLLHTMAEYYPDKPNDSDKRDMNDFLRTFGKFYPCDYCAKDLRHYMKDHPPVVDSRQQLAYWMCLAHNDVNAKLSKPQFDCSKTWERYREAPEDSPC